MYQVGRDVSKNLEIFSLKYYLIRTVFPWRAQVSHVSSEEGGIRQVRVKDKTFITDGQIHHLSCGKTSKMKPWCFDTMWSLEVNFFPLSFLFPPRSFFFDKVQLDFLNKINAYGRHRLFWRQSRHCSRLGH